MKQPVLIMAGGTGGHVFPALAVAKELQSNGIDVVWMGTQKGIESRIVPAAGIAIEWLDITGLRGKSKLTLLFAPMRLTRALWQSLKIILRVKPAVVLGMGGFVSGPGGLMAALLGKPLVLHEQNAIPGLTNRLLSGFAKVVLESFPGSFKPMKKLQLVGNPVRKDILSIDSAESRIAEHKDGIKLLVVGGSLGALVLNQTVPEAVKLLPAGVIAEVWHQTGEKFVDVTNESYSKSGIKFKVDAFIESMSEAYAWADLIICRAGAMTVSELAVCGLPSILVPYPYAVDDHQTENAKYLSENNAAILIPQSELNAESLKLMISELNREKLVQMAQKASKLARRNATHEVANICMQYGGLA